MISGPLTDGTGNWFSDHWAFAYWNWNFQVKLFKLSYLRNCTTVF